MPHIQMQKYSFLEIMSPLYIPIQSGSERRHLRLFMSLLSELYTESIEKSLISELESNFEAQYTKGMLSKRRQV